MQATESSGEWCGTSGQVLTQQLLFADRWSFGAGRGVVSQGRTLMILDAPRRGATSTLVLIEKYGRALLFGSRAFLDSVAAMLASLSVSIDRAITVFAAASDVVQQRRGAIEAAAAFPVGWTLSIIAPDTSREIVAAVQNLHAASGLVPLPGWFLRGIDGGTITTVLHDQRGEVAGCRTVIDLGNIPGGPAHSVVMGMGLCLATTARNRGLSPLLSVRTLVRGLEAFDAGEVWTLVECGNEPAIATNRKCGLSPKTEVASIFVETTGQSVNASQIDTRLSPSGGPLS